MNKVIIILGPTGVGKTGLSLLLAKTLNTEIISADSMQVYRHMDIGTAKPSREELDSIPHHLINIISPGETFSAGLFREKAIEAIQDLHSRNKIPLIVGGTGLYIRSITAGLFDGPPADLDLRGQLMKEEELEGKGHLYERLSSLDPEAARKIDPNNLRRTVRALEVSLKKNRGISECQKESTAPAGYEFIKIGLKRERKELYGLIEARADKMIEGGLVKETRELLKMSPAGTAMQAIGYKEIALYLNQAIGLEEAVRLIKKRSRMYAKRQFTWFNKEPHINWVDITGMMNSNLIFEKVINDVTILKSLYHSIAKEIADD